ncbi:MAG TPA: hypothetical protein VIK86_07490 [Candidatus Paceibacterota bacterium]
MNSLDVNLITNSLNSIEEEISNVLTWSLNEIKVNPLMEKEIISLWTKHISHIGDFLFLECERTGNKDVYKKLIKSMIFKKK